MFISLLWLKSQDLETESPEFKSQLSVSLRNVGWVIWPLCASVLSSIKWCLLNELLEGSTVITYETLSLQPSTWLSSARSANVIDSMGLESKKFFHGFCVCIKPWAQPSEDFTIFLPIIIMIHYVHKIKHNLYLRKWMKNRYFLILSPFVQSSLSHFVCFGACPCLSESGLRSVSCLGHSMMDTLSVALRVAEEAIEEAISKAEAYGDSLVCPPRPPSQRLSGRRCGWSPGCQERKCRLWGNHHHDRHPWLEPILPLHLWSGLLRKRLPSLPNTPTAHDILFLSLQDKQNEASYLRDHREELTEELATTILQKVGGP